MLTGDIALLPNLFEKVLTPERVRDELAHAEAPAAVRAWIAVPPPWLEIRSVEGERSSGDLAALDAGERDAIALALATKADLLLMDDHDGVTAARLIPAFGFRARAFDPAFTRMTHVGLVGRDAAVLSGRLL